MKTKFSLLSMDEPSDEQLHEIMADALVEVKLLNEKAKTKYNELMAAELTIARERNLKNVFGNGNK